DCEGMRLNPIARAVRLEVPAAAARKSAPRLPAQGQRRSAETPLQPNIDAFARASVQESFQFFRRLGFKGAAGQIARDILPEIRERLRFLRQVGLGYLQL